MHAGDSSVYTPPPLLLIGLRDGRLCSQADGLPHKFALVLPLLMSFCGPQDAATKRSCMKTVWRGQAFGVLAALARLTSASVALGAAVCGVVSCLGCAWVLLRQSRALRPGKT